jgi:hypothetical protein
MGRAQWIAAWLFLGVSLAVGGQTVVVDAPNGGEIWIIGDNRSIQWHSSGAVDEVRISLVDAADNAAGLIAVVPAAASAYSWHVGDLSGGGTAASGQYRIKVKVVGQQVEDKSDGLFSLVAVVQPRPSITVTSPNGGESWEIGTMHPVTWAQTDVSEHLRISLVRGSGIVVGTIAEGLLPGSSPYSWSAGRLMNGTKAPVASDYRVRVQAMGEQGGDSSDGTFAIAANPFPIRAVENLRDLGLKLPAPSVTVCVTNNKIAPLFGDRDIHLWVKNNSAFSVAELTLEFFIEGKGTTRYTTPLGPHELRKYTRTCWWGTVGKKAVRARASLKSGEPLAEVQGSVEIKLAGQYTAEPIVTCSDGSNKNEADIQ